MQEGVGQTMLGQSSNIDLNRMSHPTARYDALQYVNTYKDDELLISILLPTRRGKVCCGKDLHVSSNM